MLQEDRNMQVGELYEGMKGWCDVTRHKVYLH